MVSHRLHILTATAALAREQMRLVRRRCVFEHHKWDPQVEDVAVLSDFALRLPHELWRELAGLTERLAVETEAAERELAGRPELHHLLGLPRPIQRALRGAARGFVEAPRFLRFDFHPTTDGWRLSEVNSDVPGGFIESGGFTRLMAEHFPHLQAPPDPAEALASAIREAGGPGAAVALVHATAYADDRQVMIYLAERLERAGMLPVLVAPDQLAWHAGRATIQTDWHRGPCEAVIRFFPGEWLPNLPPSSGWQRFFGGANLCLSNPATALLTQSKRFPLAWPHLPTILPTWRALLPETLDPRRVPANQRSGLVLKPGLGRVGEDILLSDVTPRKQARRIARLARWFPGLWAAQRRFDSVPVETPHGPRHVCLGVFTVAGRAAGIYGRISPLPLIDHKAQDVAVLLEPEPAAESHRMDRPARLALAGATHVC